MNFKKFFKRRYPYAPIAFLGRKTVERVLGADITKLKKLEKQLDEEKQQSGQERHKQALDE